jgi:ubiquinone biosynthesis protein
LDNANPIPYPRILAMVEKEYGKPLNQVFKKFEQTPIGAASVSQVHKAELFDGSIVAVKIKRPDMAATFASDIKILKSLAWVAQLFSPYLRLVGILELVGYFESWIKQDLDFASEVRNINTIRQQYQFAESVYRSDLGKQVYPKPKQELCTTNIIVMDYIDGIPMSRKEQILADKNYDIEKSIKTYATGNLRNWFGQDKPYYSFQADPHLSNILALPNGDVASIDYGLISSLNRAQAVESRELAIAIYLKDVPKIIKIVAVMTKGSYKKYLAELQPDIEDYLERTDKEGFGFWFLDLAKVLVKHRIKFPRYLITFGRASIVLDGLIKTYLPEKTTLDIVGDELRRQALRETLNNIVETDWVRLSYVLSKKIKQSPKIIEDFINNPLGIISEISRAVKNA